MSEVPVIRPTGALRATGWPLIALGVVLLVVVFPLFTFGGATDQSSTGDLLSAIGAAAPWLGLLSIAAGISLVVMASRRAAANREAVQRAQLAAAYRQPGPPPPSA